MTAILSELLAVAQDVVLAAGAVFLRVGAAILVLPVLGESQVPVRVRLVLALAITAIVTPALGPGFGAAARPVYFATEPVAGLILGLSLRLLVHALQIAGTIAAQVTSLSQIAPTAMPDPMPAMGNLMAIAGLALMVILGLHVAVVEMLIASYDRLPAGQWPLGADLAYWGTARIAGAFALAMGLAAPFVLAAVLYNLALGVINRAMPQLMVAFVGAPAITFGGLLLLLAAMPVLLPVWAEQMGRAVADPLQVAP